MDTGAVTGSKRLDEKGIEEVLRQIEAAHPDSGVRFEEGFFLVPMGRREERHIPAWQYIPVADGVVAPNEPLVMRNETPFERIEAALREAAV